MKSLTTVPLLLAALIATCTWTIIDADSNWLQGLSSTASNMFKKKIETACYKKTGSSQTFEDIGVSFAAIPMCFLMINAIDLLKDLDRLQQNASIRHEFFPKYCPLIRHALPCLDSPVQQLRKCLDDDDAPILLDILHAVPEALHLICENDGEILFAEGATYEVCIKNYSNYTEECAKLVSDSTNILTLSKYTEAQCEELSMERDCMQRKLSECNGSRLTEVVDVFWRAMLKNSPCRSIR